MGFVRAVNGIFWGWLVTLLLIGTGLLYTVILKFPQFRYFKRMFTQLFKKANKEDGISPFSALCAAVGGQVGSGNLAGVATAIASGGPGAVFWMWVIGLLGMSTIYSEAILGQLFREKGEDGTYRGGPAYYLKKGAKSQFLAVAFSIATILTAGFIVASLHCNTIAAAFQGVSSIPPVIIGIIVAVLAALVLFGGAKRITTVAQVVVPFMALAYVAIALFTVIMNITQLPAVIVLIVKSAFGIQSVAGGALAYTVKSAFRYGSARGLFSNEAGQGSTPIMHAVADVDHPSMQGITAMLGCFVDTLVICSSTAFIILVTGADYSTLTGIELTQSAIGTVVGSAGPWIILVAIFLFSWTSLIANIYYGESSLAYLTQDNKKIITIYRILAVLWLVVGSIMSTDNMWELADFGNALMILPNAVGLLILSRRVKKVTDDYDSQMKVTDNPKWQG